MIKKKKYTHRIEMCRKTGRAKGCIPWNKGKRVSEETRQKMREAKKYVSLETRKKISKAMKGKPGYWTGKKLTLEHRKKLSEVKKGHNKGHIPWNKGKKMSEEFCRKVSKGNMGRIGWNKGGHVPKEVRRKMSESSKGQKPWNTGKKGGIPWNKGKKLSREVRRKMSESSKGHPGWSKEMVGIYKHSEKTLKQMRESAIKRIERQSFNGRPMTPSIGNYETQILDILEETIGYPIIRQYKVNGYFVDGYCPDYSLAIEIDEEFHNGQKEKDRLREENIKKELGCKFVRIAVPNSYISAPLFSG